MYRHWKEWVVLEKLIENGQLWEGDKCAFQIEKLNNNYRVIMFSIKEKELHFTSVAFYEDEEKLLKFLEKMKAVPTSKMLSLTRR